MKYTVRYDTNYLPNGSKTKLYVGTIRQLSNATDTLRIEFASLPSGFTPYLNVARYARDKSYIDSTPTWIGFDYVDGGYEKTLIQWFSEIAGFIDVSVTLLGEEIEVEGELTQERIECGAFYLNIDGVVISQGDTLPPPPPPTEIELKVDKDLSTYDLVTLLGIEEETSTAFTFVDNGGNAEKMMIENNGVLTELSLLTKGAINYELGLKVDKSMSAYTLMGNDTGATANAKDLTVSEVMELLSPLGKMEVPHDLEVLGNLFVRSPGYEVKLQELLVKDPTITLRDGALTGLSTGEYAGLIFHLYDGTNNGFFGVDKDGYAKVGDVGDLQTLATRQDSPVSNGIAYWNDTLKRFDTDITVTVATLRDHSLLTNRAIADQHSIGSITDLTTTLAAKAPLIEPTFTNNAIGDVPLIVNAMAGTTADLQAWKLGGSTKASVNKDGIGTFSSIYSASTIFTGTGLKNITASANASVEVLSTGTVISRNIADTNPALKVQNSHTDSTGNIAEFWSNIGGTTVMRAYVNKMGYFRGVGLGNGSSSNYSLVYTGADGTVISRNINDANPALIINEQQGTGNIANFQFGGVNKATIDKDGMGTFLGGILEPTFKNNAVGDIPATINAITGTTANLLSLQVNGVEKASIGANGEGVFPRIIMGASDYNVIIGKDAQPTTTTVSSTVAIGKSALYSNITGDDNVAIGKFAMLYTTTNRNTGVGYDTLKNQTLGFYNTAYGYESGFNLTTGIQNLFIGYKAGSHASQKVDVLNSIAIGSEVYTTANNEVRIGNTNNNAFYLGDYKADRVITASAVSVSSWSADATYSGYGYRATVTMTGATSSDSAEVVYGHNEAISGNYSPICETLTDGVYIYSKVNTTITLAQVIVHKA